MEEPVKLCGTGGGVEEKASELFDGMEKEFARVFAAVEPIIEGREGEGR